MTYPRALLLVASVAVAVAMPSSPAAATTSCKLVKVAELPIRVVRNKLIVEGAINGQSVNIMLDTGASSLIFRPAADRLGLIRQKIRGARAYGVGGESDIDSALVDELRLGDAKLKSRYMMVTGEHEIGDGIAVILGEDFFHVVDVEFDLAHNAVRLFQPKDCENASLAYWAASGASEVPIERVAETGPRIFLTVQVNGQPVRALLDSGAGASVLNRSDAARVGVVAEGPGGTSDGIGPSPVDWSDGEVHSFAIGNETIRDTKIEVADLYKGVRGAGPGSLLSQGIDRPSMLLGADFLRSHRVLVSHSQRKLYFTYLGGPVFQRRELSTSKDPDRAIADYDAAIQSDPQNAAAYFHRANAWYAKKEYERAIVDYDASIRLEPDRASVLANRGGANVAKGDYAQGMADADRALEINPNLAPALVTRGTAKRRTGNLEGAIADWMRAIELDPKLPTAYNQLAWMWATAERPALRDGRRAVESAQKACELTQWKNPTYIDTLAAAYARAGNFEDAVKWQRKAMENPRASNDDKAAQRLQSYEDGKPWPSD